jgi:hypothetical protein
MLVGGARSRSLVTAQRALRSLLPPLAVALPGLYAVLMAAHRAAMTPLGRDQGIFQYVAFALTRGEVDYRDVRDVNGPLTHLVHLAMLALGGADERRFRVLDLLASAVAFGAVGALLAGRAVSLQSTVHGPARLWTDRCGLPARAAWGLAAVVVLGGQYLGYLYWDLAQRESFFDWFLLVSVAAQLAGQARGDARLVGMAGALSVIPWFGKPTYAVFTLVQLAALSERAPARARRFAAFGAGGALGALSQLAFLFAYGDARAYARIAFVDVPALYRFIWTRAPGEILAEHTREAWLAATGAGVVLALVALRRMPWRAVAVALLPIAGLASVVAQGKGFPYHFHPVTAGIALQWLVLARWAWESTRSWRDARLLAAPLVASLALGVGTALRLRAAPYAQSTWLDADPPRDARFYDAFPEPDFFPWDLRRAAAFLRENTRDDDRVQTFGMDPYVLFLARRLSATPYIYAYDLDVTTALAGAPDAARASTIIAMRAEHEADLLAHLQARPPAAFVFLDRAPLLADPRADDDFADACPTAAAWVRAHYAEAATFGAVHVWLRSAP